MKTHKESKNMEFVNVIPAIITSVCTLIVAIAASGLIRKLASFIDKIQIIP